MKTLRYKFVELRPAVLEEGVLYISVEYCSAIHKCACGCGSEVVTPIAPTGWQLTFDGRSVSLYPSIGNWNFDCRSHYWIIKNEIQFAESWTEKQVQLGRQGDHELKKGFYADSEDEVKQAKVDVDPNDRIPRLTFWERLLQIFYRLTRRK